MPDPTVIEWLKSALTTAGISQAELARRIGVRADVVTNILKGKRNLSAHELLRASAALGIPAPHAAHSHLFNSRLTNGAHSSENVPSDREPTYLRVVGEVAGGHWKQMDIMDFDEFEVPYLIDPRWPTEAVSGLVVRGESINRQASDGDTVAVLDVHAAPRSFQDGDWVVVRRQRGDLAETTVKRVKRAGDEWLLMPDSTDSRFQAPIPLMDSDRPDEVQVIGFVLDFIKPGTRF